MAPRRYMKPLLMQKNNGVRILQIHMINEFPCPSGAEKRKDLQQVSKKNGWFSIVHPGCRRHPGNYILDIIFHADRSPMLIIMLRECCLINQSCLL